MGSITVPDHTLQRQKKPFVTLVLCKLRPSFRRHGRGGGFEPRRPAESQNTLGVKLSTQSIDFPSSSPVDELTTRRAGKDFGDTINNRPELRLAEGRFLRTLKIVLQTVVNEFHILPAPPRSGIENRTGLRNVVQNLVQLRAEEAPIYPLGSSLLH
jgi:hypothetical protein